jgi:hypothetical protein
VDKKEFKERISAIMSNIDVLFENYEDNIDKISNLVINLIEQRKEQCKRLSEILNKKVHPELARKRWKK